MLGKGLQSFGRNWLSCRDTGDRIPATGPLGAAWPFLVHVALSLKRVPFLTAFTVGNFSITQHPTRLQSPSPVALSSVQSSYTGQWAFPYTWQPPPDSGWASWLPQPFLLSIAFSPSPTVGRPWTPSGLSLWYLWSLNAVCQERRRVPPYREFLLQSWQLHWLGRHFILLIFTKFASCQIPISPPPAHICTRIILLPL